MDPIVFIIALIVLGILLALLIWAIAVVTRSFEEDRGNLILSGIWLFFILGFLSIGWLMEHEAREPEAWGAQFAFEQAASQARLYKLLTDYELADSATRAKLYPDVLKICQSPGFIRIIPTGCNPPSCIERSAKEIGWEIKCDTGVWREEPPSPRIIEAYDIANLWMLSEGNDLKHRVDIFRNLMLNGTFSNDWILWDNARISQLLCNDKVPEMQPKNVQYNLYVNRLIAYSLLSWNVKRQRYDTAFDKLQVALGKEWLDSGVVDNWWKKNLPLRVKDHLIFGYVLYKSGHTDKALREYRLAKGFAKSGYIMRREYGKEFRF